MALTSLRGNRVHTVADLPALGKPAPDFSLTGPDLGEITRADFAGRRLVLNIFPSIDTPTCATSVRRFNEVASSLENTTVLCISADLPFAMGRFCGAEGIENVQVGSVFRSDFGRDYGVTLQDGPLAGLCARSIVVVDAEGIVRHVELVDDIAHEPDYDAAVTALS